MSPQETGCPVFCMVVDADGGATGNLGVLRFSHVPAVGAKVIARRHPTKGDHPEDDGRREYVVRRLVYDFKDPDEGSVANLSGWEIEVEEVGFANPIVEARVKGLA